LQAEKRRNLRRDLVKEVKLAHGERLIDNEGIESVEGVASHLGVKIRPVYFSPTLPIETDTYPRLSGDAIPKVKTRTELDACSHCKQYAGIRKEKSRAFLHKCVIFNEMLTETPQRTDA
jgi:hypothetical protein